MRSPAGSMCRETTAPSSSKSSGVSETPEGLCPTGLCPRALPGVTSADSLCSMDGEAVPGPGEGSLAWCRGLHTGARPEWCAREDHADVTFKERICGTVEIHTRVHPRCIKSLDNHGALCTTWEGSEEVDLTLVRANGGDDSASRCPAGCRCSHSPLQLATVGILVIAQGLVQ